MTKLHRLFGMVCLCVMATGVVAGDAGDAEEMPWDRKTPKKVEYTILYERDPKLCRMLEAYYERVHTEEVNRDWGILPSVWRVQRPPSDEEIKRTRTPATEEWMKAMVGDRDLLEIDVDNDGRKEFVLEDSISMRSVEYNVASVFQCRLESGAGCGALDDFGWLLKPIAFFGESAAIYTGVSSAVPELSGTEFSYRNSALLVDGPLFHSFFFRYSGNTFVLQHEPLWLTKGGYIFVGKPQLLGKDSNSSHAKLQCAGRFEVFEE